MPDGQSKLPLHSIEVGDVVTRMLAGSLPMRLIVTEVTEDVISCGGEDGWNFCAFTGAEIDEELGWGPPPKLTGSFIYLQEKIIKKKDRTDDKAATG